MQLLKQLPIIKIFIAGMLALAIYLLFFVPVELGGDIVEYHGITESLIKSQRLYLTDVSAYNISTYLSPEYLKDPGYYIEGKDGNRYPVHFVLYSFLSLPIRLVLKLFQLNELLALRMTNLVILGATLYYIMKRLLPTSRGQLALLFTIFTSPVVTFIIWPGPDIYYLCLLLLSVFLFFRKSYVKSMLTAALASLHSQPLIIYTLALSGYYIYQYMNVYKAEGQRILQVALRPVLISLGIVALTAIPYIYNLIIFGQLSPWTTLKDGWTQLNGFGIQNISLQKLFEQFFDLNFGLFWYAPLALILGTIVIIQKLKTPEKKEVIFILLATLVTALFYQTNPAWHYGTAGYGPSRHAIFLLPIFIYFAIQFLMQPRTIKSTLLITLLATWSIAILTLNGYFTPKLYKTLEHSPYAKFVLDKAPKLYNPTPEIFVDRTNHLDIKNPTSAIYKYQNVCKKAYILRTDKALLENKCGVIPASLTDFFDDEFKRKASYKRTVTTNEITFWPDPASCGKDYFTSEKAPFVCMRTLDEVIKSTGVYDPERFSKIPKFDHPGIWKMKKGTIVNVNIPPGYVIDYSSFEGKYINF